MAVNFDLSRMAEIRENYERWWNGTLDRPLVRGVIYDAHPICRETRAPLLGQANCTDFSWSAEELIDTIDADLSQYEYIGDGFPYVNLDSFGPGVLAAFCGARLDNSSGQVWFFPAEKKDISEIHANYDPENIYVKRIKDIYLAGLDRWQGSVIMGMPDLGGILDVVAALVGSEELLFALIEEPEEVKRLVGEVQEAWHQAYNDFAEVLKPQGGYTDWSQLFSSTPSYILQSDFSYMISPDMFSEFVMDSLKEDTRRLDHTIYHLDGVGALPHLDQLLTLPDLNAVQWVYGAGKPGPMHWLDVYKKIADSGKQMMINGSAKDFLGVLEVVHGSPYSIQGFSKNDMDFAKKVLAAR